MALLTLSPIIVETLLSILSSLSLKCSVSVNVSRKILRSAAVALAASAEGSSLG